mmetsp:Transcript_27272/g.69542  ORF Transcript_27272/g.69542 Transcript_27272/m.69542 type:complete len:98 (-) Transcript_27272:325-618(-)|eukprot:2536032-Prymnesium_polylepis.1
MARRHRKEEQAAFFSRHGERGRSAHNIAVLSCDRPPRSCLATVLHAPCVGSIQRRPLAKPVRLGDTATAVGAYGLVQQRRRTSMSRVNSSRLLASDE